MGGRQSKQATAVAPQPPTTIEAASSSSVPDAAPCSDCDKNDATTIKSAPAAPADSAGGQPGGGGGGGGCPMKLEGGGYKMAGWLPGWVRGKDGVPKGHPSISSATATAEAPSSASPAAAEQGGGGCPVKASSPKSVPQQQQSEGGGCPVKAGKSGSGQVQYNVYSQPIDPTNQMPAVANQLPNANQQEELSTERVKSTIPKGGADDGTTWTYPSPQMFYNSLARKGKLAESDEAVVESVVALHNNMNEKTWAKVLEWEATSDPAGAAAGGSKLLRFLGRPSDLSPKARIKSVLLGHPLPFDRHDWTVVRPDGKEVRYVIDYYHDDEAASESADSAMPNMHDRDAVRSILVDVRPALDGPSELFDRIATMPYARRVAGTTQFEPLPLLPTADLKEQVDESHRTWEAIQEKAKEKACSSSDEEAKPKTIVVGRDEDEDAQVKIGAEEAAAIAASLNTIRAECVEAQQAVKSCGDDAECARASLALTMCMGQIACPLQHDAVSSSLNADHDPNDARAVEEYNLRLDKALENISACVAGVGERAAMARMVHPEAFEQQGKEQDS